jgi:hypothetical protein
MAVIADRSTFETRSTGHQRRPFASCEPLLTLEPSVDPEAVDDAVCNAIMLAQEESSERGVGG